MARSSLSRCAFVEMHMLDDIKKTLWATADKLRANMDAAEYKHLVLGLIFVKYISDTFAARRAEVAARLSDPNDEYYYGEAAAEDLAAELDDRDYYTSGNVFWVNRPENAPAAGPGTSPGPAARSGATRWQC